MPHCPYCSSRVTRNLQNHAVYWFCRSCWLRISTQELEALCPSYREEDICPTAGLSLEKQVGRGRRATGLPAYRETAPGRRAISAERLCYTRVDEQQEEFSPGKAAGFTVLLDRSALQEPELEKVPG